MRFGRVHINAAHVIKVVSDAKAKTTTVYMTGGLKASFKKHAKAVWDYFKIR